MHQPLRNAIYGNGCQRKQRLYKFEDQENATFVGKGTGAGVLNYSDETTPCSSIGSDTSYLSRHVGTIINLGKSNSLRVYALSHSWTSVDDWLHC